ncbi:DEAD/DEAH box helicase family protein [uncultured Methanobrevibacter sp.]|uniref:DEAD/DEAH box helicase family protein n=1 Tax=uncultured Methanobrevibacter sp. TaxID=253161 RepID=UPI0025E38741|nr:DEAD/DEAH box helicase family protein [uncultured Methanobrevibacter sp.]
MKTFQELNFKEHYDSQKDNLLKDFYIPALANSKKYRRVVGYFNSKSLASVAIGLKDFILNNGKMDLLCGVDLNPADVNMINFASKHPEEILTSNFLNELNSIEDEIVKNHVKILGWMIANKQLRIRVAVKTDENGIPVTNGGGILHYKIGLMYDCKNNLISFSGSINETSAAWEKNGEEFHLFRDWNLGELKHLKENLVTFTDLWNSNSESYKILDIPEAIEQKLIDDAPENFDDLIFHDTIPPMAPKIELYDYQIDARDKWFDNDKRGIFVMATGTGKTYTALGCLQKLLLDDSLLLTVITAPTKHLLPQWNKSIEDLGLNLDRVITATGDTKWRKALEDGLLDLRLHIINNLVVLTTHDTLASDDFINYLKEYKKFNYFLIGDEMHGLGSPYRTNGLNDKLYDFRLGLSATPTRYSDEESDFLFEFFGDELYKISLEDAIYNFYNPRTGKSYLTPYNYHPYFLSLTKEELEKYKKITLNLFKFQDEEYSKQKANLLFQRADLIKDAFNKFNVFEEVLDDIDDYSGLIIYCSHNQIDKVLNILARKNIVAHKFTMEEKTTPLKEYGGLSEREMILKDFDDGNYHVLVAMHCLDEGVDVPSASKAIFMCSSNSSREFIQRIGRVIRRYEGKTHADIYDLIVRPSGDRLDKSLQKFEKFIFEREKERYKQIGYIAENYDYVIKELNKNL